jgi:hypothetical protein
MNDRQTATRVLLEVLRNHLLYRSFLAVHNRKVAERAEVIDYITDVTAYLGAYRAHWCQLLRVRSVDCTDKSCVEGAVYESYNDYAKMASRKDFYKINAHLCCHFAEKLLSKLTTTKDANDTIRLMRLLDRHLISGLALINHLHMNLFQGKPVFGVGVTTVEPEFLMYREALQSIYSSVGSPRVDLHLATNSIRAMIELRIKRSMGVFAVLNKKDMTQVPIKMDVYFLVYDAFVRNGLIDVIIPLAHIRRIYRWASVYLHVGVASYPWLPLFCLDYMASLFNGRQLRRGFDVDSGILASREAIHLYQRTLRKLLDRSKLGREQRYYIHAYETASSSDPSRA